MLNLFRRRAAPDLPSDFRTDFLFVGTWSYRKGCDLLVAAMATLPDATLLHVGPKGDIPIPRSVRSLGFVDQNRLPAIYHRARILVLPSREDGFGVVLSQALASGLLVVCSDHTGGPDLAALSDGIAARMWIVPAGDVDRLAVALRDALTLGAESGRLS